MEDLITEYFIGTEGRKQRKEEFKDFKGRKEIESKIKKIIIGIRNKKMNNKDYLETQLSQLMEKKDLDFVNQFYVSEKTFNKDLYHRWFFLSLDYLKKYKCPRIEEFNYYYFNKNNNCIYSALLCDNAINREKYKLFILIQYSIIKSYLNFDRTINEIEVFKYKDSIEFSTEMTKEDENQSNLINYLNWYNDTIIYISKKNIYDVSLFINYFINKEKLKGSIQEKKIDLSDFYTSAQPSYKINTILEIQFSFLQFLKEKFEDENLNSKELSEQMRSRRNNF